MNEKIKTGAAWVILLFGVGVLAWLFLRYAAGILLPFLIGWAAAMAVRRPAAFLGKKTFVGERVWRLTLAVSALILLSVLSYMAVRSLIAEVSALLARLQNGVFDPLSAMEDLLLHVPFLAKLLPDPQTIFSLIGEEVVAVLPNLIGALMRFLPSFFLAALVSVICTVYFCLDLPRIHAAFRRLLPPSWSPFLLRIKQNTVDTLCTVLRANVYLMLIAFALLLPAFLILGVKSPLLCALILSLLDLLPVIGVGLFLVPWGIFWILTGNVFGGVGMLLLMLIISVVRQFAEPHLLGKDAGMHPLLGLLALYGGAKLYGGVGMLAAPAILLLVYGLLVSPTKKEPNK